MHSKRGKRGPYAWSMNTVNCTSVVIMVVVWLAALGIVGDAAAQIDFSPLKKPGFGTREGILGTGWRGPRNEPEDSTSRQKEKKLEKQRRKEEKKAEKLRRENEKKALEAQKKALRALLKKDIAKIKIKTPSDPVNIPARRGLGSMFFNVGGIPGFKGEIPTGSTEPTEIASENLRRAALIVAGLRKAKSPEDKKFLADEAGKAMIKAPLQVVVPSASEYQRLRDIKRLIRMANEIERSIFHLQDIRWERSRLEKELFEIEKRKKAGSQKTDIKNKKSGSQETYRKDQEELQKIKAEYHAIWKMEKDAYKDLTQQQETFQKEMLDLGVDFEEEEGGEE